MFCDKSDVKRTGHDSFLRELFNGLLNNIHIILEVQFISKSFPVLSVSEHVRIFMFCHLSCLSVIFIFYFMCSKLSHDVQLLFLQYYYSESRDEPIRLLLANT